MVTSLVPPGSFLPKSAVDTLRIVIILIFSGEWHTAMQSIRVGLAIVRQVNCTCSTGEDLWASKRAVCAVQDCISMS